MELFFPCSAPHKAASFWHSTPCIPQPCSASDSSSCNHPTLYPIQLPVTSLLCNLSAKSDPKHRLAMTSPGPDHFFHSQKSICILGRDLSHAGAKSSYWSCKVFNRCPLRAMWQGQILIATSLAQLGGIQMCIFILEVGGLMSLKTAGAEGDAGERISGEEMSGLRPHHRHTNTPGGAAARAEQQALEPGATQRPRRSREGQRNQPRSSHTCLRR